VGCAKTLKYCQRGKIEGIYGVWSRVYGVLEAFMAVENNIDVDDIIDSVKNKNVIVRYIFFKISILFLFNMSYFVK